MASRADTSESYAGAAGYYQDPINGPAFLPLANDENLQFITLVR